MFLTIATQTALVGQSLGFLIGAATSTQVWNYERLTSPLLSLFLHTLTKLLYTDGLLQANSVQVSSLWFVYCLS